MIYSFFFYYEVKLSSKIVFAETNVQMTSEVAQGSPTSIDSYHRLAITTYACTLMCTLIALILFLYRTDESHRVMADSDRYVYIPYYSQVLVHYNSILVLDYKLLPYLEN